MEKPNKAWSFSVFLLVSLSLLVFNFAVYGQEKPSGYVGSDACKECHQEYFLSYSKSIHGKKAIPGSPGATQGCESCHGGGAVHIEKGGKGGILAFGKKGDGRIKSAPCLTCHENSKEMLTWSMGRHMSMGVSCDSCHMVHSTTKNNLKALEPGLCIGCHKNIRNQISRQSRHPIQEGKMRCTSCHTPHGGLTNKMLKTDSITELCYKCHTEKRGPYAFEHPPVSENCINCHSPHGSNHTGLLTRRSPQLCQGCHNLGFGHTSNAYTLQHGFGGKATANKNRFFAQGCLNCHGNIHGSNRSPIFER
ncbi:MAG: DmsE family decaheme c-type cytochrome [Syntrophorhabdaceae bacterium]|nr:DmsE family decaheme c-type cytochrome [Syntrophorhabdaceae bacterium]